MTPRDSGVSQLNPYNRPHCAAGSFSLVFLASLTGILCLSCLFVECLQATAYGVLGRYFPLACEVFLNGNQGRDGISS